ncbi:hypothetical protein Tco_0985861 [Tanacetum coccineum]
MPANQEHVHLAWPLWSDLRVIPTHGKFGSLVRPMAIFARFCLVDLNRLPFLEQPIPAMPVSAAGQVLSPDVLNTQTAWVKASKEIVGHPELLQIVREFHACKQEGQSVSSYVLKMKSYIDNLERLGHAMTQNLSVSPILVSRRKEYDGFVQNYNMHSMRKTVTELHDMLKLHEQTLPPREATPAFYAIRAGRVQKNQKKKSHKDAKGNQGKGKAKMGYAPVPAPPFAPKPKNPPTPKKDNPIKDVICHQCGEGLRGSRKLKPGALSLYVGDGHRAAVEAIGEFHLNNLIYFNAIPRDDIYEIVLSSSNTNDSYMYVVSNKRVKLNLDTTLLWHYRLGHISKNVLRSYNMMDFSIHLTLSLLKSVFPACLERWQENLIHIKWKGLKIYLD